MSRVTRWYAYTHPKVGVEVQRRDAPHEHAPDDQQDQPEVHYHNV